VQIQNYSFVFLSCDDARLLQQTYREISYLYKNISRRMAKNSREKESRKK